MTEQQGGPDSTSEGREIRNHVVDGGDEPLVRNMGDGNDDTARECHSQEKTHHNQESAQNPQQQALPTFALVRTAAHELAGRRSASPSP
jgi:hypothetical protein